MFKVLEMSSRADKSGRKTVSFIAHEIYTDGKSTNKRGIHWTKEYTQNNIESLKGIPICCEFADDDNTIPIGHGFTGQETDTDGKTKLFFENSIVVGTVESGEIKSVEVEGKMILALICHGYVYVHRFPKFHEWLKQNWKLGVVDTSIEITGVDEGDIVYENNICSKEFRTPMIYDYSGTAILSISPADDSAIVLEVAQLSDGYKNKEENNMEDGKIIEVVKSTILETNSKNDELSGKITELNSEIETKDVEINELNEAKEAAETKVTELNSEIETLKEKNESLQNELNEAKKKELNSELDKMLEKYTDEQKEIVTSEINSYKENPLEGNADAIVSKICVGIVNTQMAEAAKKVTEQNAAKDEDIFSIFSEVNDESDTDDDIAIFE